MSRLLVFNPEHDYALSSREGFYVAKARIRKLASERDLLPLLWCDEADYILRADDRIVRTCRPEEECNLEEVIKEVRLIEPWGWDKTLCNRLLNIGFDEALLPADEKLEAIKRLSHRRLTIDLNKFLRNDDLPEEFFSVDDALEFFKENPDCFFKAPWSSSGRGVISTSTMKNKMVGEWIHGVIRRQGSVMGERNHPKALDFASLWICKNGEVEFRGLSISKTSNRGKYSGNICANNKSLERIVKMHTSYFNEELIDRQKKFIAEKIAPEYDGRLGIDMMAGIKGEIYSGVEINLRNTMGHVAMDYFSRLKEENEGKFLPDRFGLMIPSL